MALAVEKHVGLILVPAPGNPRERGQAGGRDRPQPGLRVPQGNAAQAVQEKGHGLIAAFTPGRHLGAGKIPAAQYQRLGMPEQLAGAAERVPPAVLPVSVHSDYPGIRPALDEEGQKPYFQCLPLPAVVRQMDDLTVQRFQCVKIRLTFRPAAVVHHDDVAEAGRPQLLHGGNQPPVRVVGRDQRANIHLFHSISGIFALDASIIVCGNESPVKEK